MKFEVAVFIQLVLASSTPSHGAICDDPLPATATSWQHWAFKECVKKRSAQLPVATVPALKPANSSYASAAPSTVEAAVRAETKTLAPPVPAKTAALKAGVDLATLYHSAVCEKMRTPAAFKSLENIAPWALQEARAIKQPKYLAKGLTTRGHPQAIYIRNQKVASTMLDDEPHLYAGSGGDRLRFKFRLDPSGPSRYPCDNNVFFTVVRDPIKAFVSGWLQDMCWVMRRMKDKSDGGPSLLMAEGRHPQLFSNPSGQFQAFLEDYANQRFLGDAATHVWPQADKIDALPGGCNFTFIGKLETLSQSMSALFPGGRLSPQSHTAEEDLCKVEILKTFKYGVREVRQMCELLAADFKCFGYPLPKECQ